MREWLMRNWPTVVGGTAIGGIAFWYVRRKMIESEAKKILSQLTDDQVMYFYGLIQKKYGEPITSSKELEALKAYSALVFAGKTVAEAGSAIFQMVPELMEKAKAALAKWLPE